MADVICPNCGKSFEIDRALKLQIEEKARREIEVNVRNEIGRQSRLEILDLKKALAEKDEKMAELRDQELTLRGEKRRLEEAKKEMDLKIERKLDSERKKIEETVLKEAFDKYRLKDMEKEKMIQDLRGALADAQRKASQTSQQLQGEVLELDLEETLKAAFASDTIEGVEKGVRGADVRQIVKSPKGVVCGVILWESKRTKVWSDSWILKLKEDLRAEGANIPVIISEVLPKEIQGGLGLKDGVWVCAFPLLLALATLLRKNLLDVGFQKAVLAHKGKKADLLYEYVTGHEFRQQVEALTEVYNEMREQLDKERASFERSWKAREGQMKRMVLATANVYGSMQGLVGSSMPQVKGLDLMELESGE